ncbi:MAG: antitoxin VapB family protein [Candidatus Micrarchaeota archaeon]|nr:antitoxin [Candidatus Micrarchaeota archaeon]MBU1681377.1 antitoxin [Candidatus Micrarchaeota archaeon]
MVRVITIMDDVYDELKRLKSSKDMSFSQVLRFLLKERKQESTIISLAGSIEDKDIARREVNRIKREEYNWIEQ